MMLLWYPNRKTKGFDVEEKLVYQIIEEAGNKGKLWFIQSILFLFVCLFVCLFVWWEGDFLRSESF